LVLCLCTGGVAAQPLPAQYVVRDLGPYPDATTAGSPGFAPAALNDRGILVGWANAETRHAFRWTDGVLVDLAPSGPPPFLQSTALSINNRGRILGTTQSLTNFAPHPALFEGGAVVDLGGLMGVNALASAINDAGQIAGTVSVLGQLHAARVTGSTVEDLGVLPGGNSSIGNALNNRGDVVGFSGATTAGGGFGDHAFLSSGGVLTDLGTLPLGSQNSDALGVNDAGVIVGFSACATPNHAFLYANGQMNDLGTFGGGLSTATAINQHGVVVGAAEVVAGVSHAFVYADGVKHDLNDMAPAVADRTFVSALGINNRGQILVVGRLQGQNHSFLLDPDSLGRFHPLPPCRVVDTRGPVGVDGGPPLDANADRAFQVGGVCGVPVTSPGVALNLTVTQATEQGSITILPSEGGSPAGASLSWRAGQSRANNAILGIDSTGRLVVHLDQAAGTAHLVLDVSGYFE
jgi:probable HAF family extracellular repeat protein